MPYSERLTRNIRIDWDFNDEVRSHILKSEGMRAELEERGKQWVERLNGELHSAQAARRQPVEDGYTYEVTTEGSRDRLYVRPFTARAIAHEAVNQSMLKLVPLGSIKANKGPDHRVPAELARGEHRAAAEERERKASAARERRRAQRRAKKQAEGT